jgi:hypothetical protein
MHPSPYDRKDNRRHSQQQQPTHMTPPLQPHPFVCANLPINTHSIGI